MSYDSDVALLGTGVAPLVAASYLLQQGKTVLILNPDWDFFLEDSELPLDPLLHGIPTAQRLIKNSPEHALKVLRPYFPGAIEFWSPNLETSGFHVATAPHVRQRGRLWISSPEFSTTDRNQLWSWEELEDFYVEASDANLNPQLLDGLSAARKFPGFSTHYAHLTNFRGLFIPKLYDVDIVRFRNGILEFIRERLGPEQVICAANQIEWNPQGVRFYFKGSLHNAKLNHGLLAFWTPRLTSWVQTQFRKTERPYQSPKGVRLWEQWILNSKEPSDPSVVGMYDQLAVWVDLEGRPLPNNFQPAHQDSNKSYRLSVLRSGPLIPLERMNLPKGGLSWASSHSFDSLCHLCHSLLRWDNFSISSLKARAVFEWENEKSLVFSKSDPHVRIVPGSDGPLVNIIEATRLACDQILEESK